MDYDYLSNLRATASGRYWGLVGIETVGAERGRVVNRVVLREEHLNYNHVVHGGVVSSLIDSAAGGAARTMRTPEQIKSRPHATSDLHVTYISPATGSELIAVAKVTKAGRTAIFTEVEVTDDRGRTVARGMVTFVIGAGPPVTGGDASA